MICSEGERPVSVVRCGLVPDDTSPEGLERDTVKRSPDGHGGEEALEREGAEVQRARPILGDVEATVQLQLGLFHAQDLTKHVVQLAALCVQVEVALKMQAYAAGARKCEVLKSPRRELGVQISGKISLPDA